MNEAPNLPVPPGTRPIAPESKIKGPGVPNPLRADSGEMSVGERVANDQKEEEDDGFGFDFSDVVAEKPSHEKSSHVEAGSAPANQGKSEVEDLHQAFEREIDQAVDRLTPGEFREMPPGTRPLPGALRINPDQNLQKTGVYDRKLLESLRKSGDIAREPSVPEDDVIELTEKDIHEEEAAGAAALRKKIVNIPELPRLAIAPQFRKTPAVMPPPRKDRVAIGPPPKPVTAGQVLKEKKTTALSRLSALWDRYSPFKKAA